MSEVCIAPCPRVPCNTNDETKRILGELAILIDGIRLYLSRMLDGAPVLN